MKNRLFLAAALIGAVALPLLAQQAPPRAVPTAPRAVPENAPPQAAPPPVAVPVKPAIVSAAPVTAAPAPISAVRPATGPASTTGASLAKPATPGPKPLIPTPSTDLQIQPSWETQKLARTYVFTIPAPRGQITDRNGVSLAQSRVSYNLAIQFPTPPEYSDAEATQYIAEQTATARGILRREVGVDPVLALKHYKNRGIMPLVIATDLRPAEVDAIAQRRPAGLVLQAAYQRIYPQGTVAAHIVGYVGRQGAFLTNPVENNEPLWPGSEGRSGIEKAFNEQLTGKPGVMSVSFDAQGRKSSEKVTVPPTPGQNVVLALDLNLQKMCEGSVRQSGQPGAMVLSDCNTGEILALASLPSFDPNDWIPKISPEDFKRLNEDKTHPLIGRAFQSSYPPGSTFKVVTGLAAMNEGKVEPDDEFSGEAAMEIGGIVFRNWKKTDAGPLNFVQALTQSCNTYFYKMGLKCGPGPILEYSQRLGLGQKTGLPIAGEDDGNLMTQEYMMRVHKRRIMPGDVANMSIGQGDTLVTPLQLASVMSTIGNGGTVFYPRLVLQVQGVDDKIIYGYDARVRDQIDIEKNVMKALRNGLIGVVQGSGGTAHVAEIPGIKIAAKTGTAQWGSGKNEKVAAWFAGFAPAERPKYAFAAVYEGPPDRNDVHGGTHAAPIAARVLKELLKPEPKEKKKGGLRKKHDEDDPEEMDDDGNDAPVRPKILSMPKEKEEEEATANVEQ
jgi:penicillin-binding protein 2